MEEYPLCKIDIIVQDRTIEHREFPSDFGTLANDEQPREAFFGLTSAPDGSPCFVTDRNGDLVLVTGDDVVSFNLPSKAIKNLERASIAGFTGSTPFVNLVIEDKDDREYYFYRGGTCLHAPNSKRKLVREVTVLPDGSHISTWLQDGHYLTERNFSLVRSEKLEGSRECTMLFAQLAGGSVIQYKGWLEKDHLFRELSFLLDGSPIGCPNLEPIDLVQHPTGAVAVFKNAVGPEDASIQYVDLRGKDAEERIRSGSWLGDLKTVPVGEISCSPRNYLGNMTILDDGTVAALTQMTHVTRVVAWCIGQEGKLIVHPSLKHVSPLFRFGEEWRYYTINIHGDGYSFLGTLII